MNKEISFFNELAKGNAERHKKDGAEQEAMPFNNENIAKDASEAREMLAHSPDLLKQLIAETEAFKDFRVGIEAKDENNHQFDKQVRLLEADIDAFKGLLEDWQDNAPSQLLEEYVEDAKDVATEKAEFKKLASYGQIMSNYFFRDRQTALLKRMDSSKTGDGSTAGSLGFESTYFK